VGSQLHLLVDFQENLQEMIRWDYAYPETVEEIQMDYP
jgi:hypothetical protein